MDALRTMMRKLRSIVLIAAACFAVAANAQIDAVSGRRVAFAEGRGVLTNRTDQAARFSFGVHQQGDRRAAGRLQFSTRTARGGVSISSERLLRLRVDKNTAVFGGRAVMEITTRTGTRRVEGTVTVRVVDNTSDRRGRDRRKIDTMKITFATRRSDRVFEFSGFAKADSMKVGYRRGDRR